MSGPGGDKPHPLLDPNFKSSRELYLADWETLVQPDQKAALTYVGHSVTYGSTALQASYILNGGALAALPALLTSLTQAGAAAIATAAVPFVCGIVLAAIASLSAYLNFQWQAHVAWFDSNETAAMLGRFYQGKGQSGDPKLRNNLVFRVQASFYLGVAAALISLGCFIWGSWTFIDLARSAAKPPLAIHTHTESRPQLPPAPASLPKS